MDYSHATNMSEYTTSNIQCDDDIITEDHLDVKIVDADALMILSDDASGICYSAPTPPAHPPPPPARILARFYRPSQTARRKSSAASSRRNSISSSTHSHHSNRSFQHHHRGGNGSKTSDHVAQHLLRRASIIENRRARLADRAAHAQQVRLRAALAKAVPQTRALSSEERALAAHQARERHLAQVAAACAEEVRRSKKVAEDMKERKAAEEKRYRLEMEERLAEADRRRAEYKKGSGVVMRRPRTASVVVDEGEKKTAVATIAEEDEEEEVAEETGGAATGVGTISPSIKDSIVILDQSEAARRIQKAWKKRKDRLAVQEFISFDLSTQRVQVSDFEAISGLLSEERVIQTTRKVLQSLMRKTNDSRNCEIDSGSTSVRAFLSIYLILGHPTAIFRQDGEQEELLMSRAKDLLTIFEAALSELVVISSQNTRTLAARFDCASQSKTATESFLAVYKTYMTAFTAWKAHDFSALVDTMVASFVELDAIWQTVKNKGGDEAAEEYREGIRNNQALILGKIKSLAGPQKANGLVLNAVRESRKGRRRSRTQDGDRTAEGTVQSRATLNADGEEGVMAEGKLLNDKPLAASDNEMDGSNLTALSSTVAAPPVAAAALAANSTIDHPQTFQLTRLFSPIPSNRVLAHELTLDRSYRITLSPYFANKKNTSNTSFHSSSTSPPTFSDSSVYVEVCAAMRQGFESGQGNVWTVAMAENIRGKLLHLLSPGSNMYNLIAETLDSGHVHRQCSKGVFSYDRFFSFMADILPRLCAPVRDAEVKVLIGRLRDSDAGVNGMSYSSSSTDRLADLMDKLLRLLCFINLLSLDYSNYMLQQAIPLLLKEAAGYEQRLFAQELENGIVTLERTRAWWKRAKERWRAEIVDNGNGNNNSTGGAPLTTSLSLSHQHIYARALLETALGGSAGVAGGLAMPVPIPEVDLPETLNLDRDRLAFMRTEVMRVVAAGAILLTAKNLLKRDVRVPWRAEASRLMELLRDGDSGNGGFTSGSGTAIEGPSMASRILTVLESSHALPPVTRTQLQGTIGKVLAQAALQFTTSTAEGSAATSKITDPVMKVLLQRVRMYIASRIGISSSTNNHGPDHTKTGPTTTPSVAPTIMTGLGTAITGGAVSTSTTPPLSSSITSSGTGNTAMGDISPLISSGLSEFVPQLAELAESLKRIGDVDWEAHSHWYLQMET